MVFLPESFLIRFFVVQTGSNPTPPEAESGAPESWRWISETVGRPGAAEPVPR